MFASSRSLVVVTSPFADAAFWWLLIGVATLAVFYFVRILLRRAPGLEREPRTRSDLP
jgi:hypothetical protein